MQYFPMYVDIRDQEILIIGGGAVAKEKLERLLQFTNRIRVVAEQTDIREVAVARRSFREEDLDQADICICATDDRELNARIAGLCRQRRIPVNVVDDPELCSFIFPALIKRGKLILSISTSGASPAYASRLRQQLEEDLPDHIEEVLDRMAELRTLVPQLTQDGKRRKAMYGAALEILLEKDLPQEELLEMLRGME